MNIFRWKVRLKDSRQNIMSNSKMSCEWKFRCFIEFMLSMIDQVLDEVIIQVNKTNESMSEYVKRMLEVMEYDVPYTANAIMEALHLKSKETFRKNYIKPAIELGLIKMTLPEKPNSKNQRYVKQ